MSSLLLGHEYVQYDIMLTFHNLNFLLFVFTVILQLELSVSKHLILLTIVFVDNYIYCGKLNKKQIPIKHFWIQYTWPLENCHIQSPWPQKTSYSCRFLINFDIPEEMSAVHFVFLDVRIQCDQLNVDGKLSLVTVRICQQDTSKQLTFLMHQV